MINEIAIFAGTFDPITNGHLDLVQRASHLFKEVIVAVAHSAKKNTLFDLNHRIKLAQIALKQFDNVKIEGFNALLVEFARQKKAGTVIRGLRAVSDFEYEFKLANMNRTLAPEIETLFLMPSEKYSYISSSLIKEVAQFKGNIKAFVPSVVAQALEEKFNHGT